MLLNSKHNIGFFFLGKILLFK
jgi:hypothetical protein